MPLTPRPPASTEMTDARPAPPPVHGGVDAPADANAVVAAFGPSLRSRSASLDSDSDSDSIKEELQRLCDVPAASSDSFSDADVEALSARAGTASSHTPGTPSPGRPDDDPIARSRLRPRSATPETRQLLSDARQAIEAAAPGQRGHSLVMEGGTPAFVEIPAAGQRLLQEHGIDHRPARHASQMMAAALQRGGHRAPSPPMTLEDLEHALYSVGPRSAQGTVADDALARTVEDVEKDWRKMDAGGAASEADSWEHVRKDFFRNAYLLDGETVSPTPIAAFPRVPGSSDDEHEARWEAHCDARWQDFHARVAAFPDEFRRLVLAGAHQGSVLLLGNAVREGRDGMGRGVLHEQGAFVFSDPKNKENTCFRIESGADGHLPAVHISYTRHIAAVTANPDHTPDLETMAQATSKGSHYHLDLQMALWPRMPGDEDAPRVAIQGQHRVEIAYPSRGARLLDAIRGALDSHDDPQDAQQAVIAGVQAYARHCRLQVGPHDPAAAPLDAAAAAQQQRALHEQAIDGLARHHACPAQVVSAELMAALGVLNGAQLNEPVYAQALQAHGFLQQPAQFTAVVDALDEASGYTVANQLNEVATGVLDASQAMAAAAPVGALRAADAVESVHPVIRGRLVQLGLPVRQADIAHWSGDLANLSPAPPLALQVGADATFVDVLKLQAWTVAIKEQVDGDEREPDRLARWLLDAGDDGTPRLRALLNDAQGAHAAGVATSLPASLAQMALTEVHAHVVRHAADGPLIADVQHVLLAGPTVLLPADDAWQAARDAQAHLLARSLYYIEGDRGALRAITDKAVRTGIGALRDATGGEPAYADLKALLPQPAWPWPLRDIAGRLPHTPPPPVARAGERAAMASILDDCTRAIVGVVADRAQAHSTPGDTTPGLEGMAGRGSSSAADGRPPAGLRGGGRDAPQAAAGACSNERPQVPGPRGGPDRDDPGAASSLAAAPAPAALPDRRHGSLPAPHLPARSTGGDAVADAGERRLDDKSVHALLLSLSRCGYTASAPVEREARPVRQEAPAVERGARCAKNVSRWVMKTSPWTDKEPPRERTSQPAQVAAAGRLLAEVGRMAFASRAPILLDADVVNQLTELAVHESITPLAGRGSNGKAVATLVATSLASTFAEAIANGRQDEVVRAIATGDEYSALSRVARWQDLTEMQPLVRLLLVELPSDPQLADRLSKVSVFPDRRTAVALESVMPDPARIPPREPAVSAAVLAGKLEAHARGVTARDQADGRRGSPDGRRDTVDFLGQTMSRDAYERIRLEGRDHARQLSARNVALATASAARKQAHQESLQAGEVARVEQQIHQRRAVSAAHAHSLAAWSGRQLALADDGQGRRATAARLQREHAALPAPGTVRAPAIAAGADAPRVVAGSATPVHAPGGHERVPAPAAALAAGPVRALPSLQVPPGSRHQGDTLIVPADMRLRGQTLAGEIQVALADPAPVLVIPASPRPPQYRDAVTDEVVQLRQSPGTPLPAAAPPPGRPSFAVDDVRQHRTGLSIDFNKGLPHEATGVFPAETFHSMRFQCRDGYIALTHQAPRPSLEGGRAGLCLA